jgi:hypothetical protein
VIARTQLQIFLGVVLVSMAAVIIIFVGFNEEKRMVEFAQSQQAEAIEVDADLFETNCIGCHGIKGDGIQGLAPPLNDRHFFSFILSWQAGAAAPGAAPTPAPAPSLLSGPLGVLVLVIGLLVLVLVGVIGALARKR